MPGFYSGPIAVLHDRSLYLADIPIVVSMLFFGVSDSHHRYGTHPQKGGGLGTQAILIVGVATIVADGLSMGLGEYLSSKAMNEYMNIERKREEWELANHRQVQCRGRRSSCVVEIVGGGLFHGVKRVGGGRWAGLPRFEYCANPPPMGIRSNMWRARLVCPMHATSVPETYLRFTQKGLCWVHTSPLLVRLMYARKHAPT